MKPIGFPEQNGVVGLNDLTTNPIPIERTHGMVLSRWKTTWRERFSVLRHGTIWLVVAGDVMPPVLLSGVQTFRIENPPQQLHGEAGFDEALHEARKSYE